MKVQIDENKYLTGNYCLVGNIDNSIQMASLPDDDFIYFKAYKLLSRLEDKKVTVNEPVVKQRPVEHPILDADGNETGETETVMEDYIVIEPVEKIIQETVYFYELDINKKEKIQEELKNFDPDKSIYDTKLLDYDEVQNQFKQHGADIEYIALLLDVEL